MKTIDLLAPLLDRGIRNTNFFNGRLLSAEDLSAEQNANRQHHELLGRAGGEGVAFGLEVSVTTDPSSPPDTTRPLLKVTAGLALNRKGQTLSLPDDATIRLVPAEEEQAAVAGLFAACEPPTTEVYQTGTGVYILAIAPSSGYEGKAPMSGLGEEPGAGRACGRRYAVEGVQFRLVEMNINTLAGISDATRSQVLELMNKSKDKNDAASREKLRNILAHLCFGTEELATFAADPFRKTEEGRPAYLAYDALDALRAKDKLTDCDVPLAMIYWTRDGVQFVDMWSVRRRVSAQNKSLAWPLAVDDRRQAEGEAMFLQFQDQMDEMFKANPSELEKMKATSYFRYLPPAGILPLAAKKGSQGIKLVNFASGLTLRDKAILEILAFPDRIFMEGAKLGPLLREAAKYPPIDLKSRELIWTYLVRENIQAIDEQPPKLFQPYLVFTNGQMPFAGDARFDLSYWAYSNYSSTLAS
jgi:hypothetical protein